MFATWRHKSTGDSGMQCSDRPITQKACIHCRTKKLRCTGQETGCLRCERLQIICYYPSWKGTKRDARSRRGVLSSRQEHEHQLPCPTPTKISPQGQVQRPLEADAQELVAPDVPGGIHSPATPFQELTTPLPSRFPGEHDMTDNLDYFSVGDIGRHGGPSPVSTVCEYNARNQGISNVLSGEIDGPVTHDTTEQWQVLPALIADTRLMGASPDTSSSGSLIMSSTSLSAEISIANIQQHTPSINPAFTQETGVIHQVTGDLGSSSGSGSEAQKVSKIAMGRGDVLPTCFCQQRVVFLIDELESRLFDNTVAGVDSIGEALASHKEAARYGESMLACKTCSVRIENMTLLFLLAERLVRLCEGLISAYMDGMKRESESVQQAVLFGEYEVDSPAEWDLLLGNCIILQLRAVYSLVSKIVGGKHIQGARSRILTSLRGLADKIHRESPASTPRGVKVLSDENGSYHCGL